MSWQRWQDYSVINPNMLNPELRPDFLRNSDPVQGFYGQKLKKVLLKIKLKFCPDNFVVLPSSHGEFL